MSTNQEGKLRPAIVLATHTMGLGVIRALGMMDVPVVAVYYDRHKDMGYVSKYVKHKIYAPHPERAEDDFLDQLVECASRFGGGLLIPVSDETLITVSRHKDLLGRHYVVACTEWDITRRLIDKQHTYALAEAVGVAAPKTLIPRSLEDVERYGKTIEYPCLVKPYQSHLFYAHFGRKMVPVRNLEQMLAVYQQAVDAGMEVMLQEIIPGDDTHVVNYNSYFWDGQPSVEFTAQQLRKAPPEFGSPCVAASKQIPEVIEPGRRILQATGFYGYSCTEFKKDPRDGVYKLMEVNGRHNLSSLLAVRCGINFPWLQYKHLIQGELPSAPSYRTGIYWIDITRDASYSVRCLSKHRYSPVQYVLPYLKPHVFAVLDLKDPKPFMKRLADLIMRAIKATHLAAERRSGSKPQ
jgi:D-aspartate ligase